MRAHGIRLLGHALRRHLGRLAWRRPLTRSQARL